MLNRRDVFSAAAAVAVIAAPAVTVASVRTDSALLELGAEYERVVAAHQAAVTRSATTYLDFKVNRPSPPDALIVSRADAFDFSILHAQISRPLTAHGYVHLEKWLADKASRNQAASLRLEPRARELLKAYDDHEAATQRVMDAVGHKQASDAEERLYERVCELERSILAAPCTSLAGLKVKALVAHNNREQDDVMDLSERAAFAVVDYVMNGGMI